MRDDTANMALMKAWSDTEKMLEERARSITRCPFDAEDALQETFLSLWILWLDRGHEHDRAQFRPIARAIVRNKSIDSIRRRSRCRSSDPQELDAMAGSDQSDEGQARLECGVVANGRERDVLHAMRIGCKTVTEIAQLLRVSRTRVRALIRSCAERNKETT
jgi:RNA polymerase sigma factor (sigma-70 family)